jgi:hypothetical protein
MHPVYYANVAAITIVLDIIIITQAAEQLRAHGKEMAITSFCTAPKPVTITSHLKTFSNELSE